MSSSTTILIEHCLLRLGGEDSHARSELLTYARRRLELLAKRMFRRCPQLYSRVQSDDLLQEAMIRLWQSVEAVGPTTVAGFMGLAALQMRRALCDLARSHFGRNPLHTTSEERLSSVHLEIRGRDHAVMEDPRNGPEELACWSELHSAVDRLPEPDRTAFDLLFYHELPQSEVAALMQVSVRQVQRYWTSSRIKLGRMMGDTWPEL